MKLAGLPALKLSFYKSFIAEKTSLNEPAELAEEYSPMRGFASLGYPGINDRSLRSWREMGVEIRPELFN
jgi:hypothetical protein